MRWLLHKLGLARVVITIDHDEEERLRIVHKTPSGREYVYGISWTTKGYLHPNGNLVGPHAKYLSKWRNLWEYRKKRKDVSSAKQNL